MLTAVFMCQPLGQLAATLVTLIAGASNRNGLPSDATMTSCNAECKRTLDSVWRWIIGVGVIPAVIAIWFRLTIIESPRYTADVGRDSRKAASELHRYLLLQAQTAAASTSSIHIHGQDLRLRPATSGASSGAISEIGPVQHNRTPSPYDTNQSPLPGHVNSFPNDSQKRHSGAVSEVGQVSQHFRVSSPS